MSSCCVILGSAHNDGCTSSAVHKIFEPCPPVYALTDYTISPYDYSGGNKDDDFFPLIKELLTYKTWIFATPIYWYTMSAQLKIFIDRFTDLLYLYKEQGRALKGKRAFIVCTSGGGKPEFFESPLVQTFAYFEMQYTGICDLLNEKNPLHETHNPPQILKGKQWFAQEVLL